MPCWRAQREYVLSMKKTLFIPVVIVRTAPLFSRAGGDTNSPLIFPPEKCTCRTGLAWNLTSLAVLYGSPTEK